ncbi:DUF7261 family protein [Halapricum desulfuricans]|uniref:Putative pilin/flagellin n=1 Tax=Halapricum desulfuricans TaxID=2841257 RepID=A0A897NWJ8_9EURY|nr:hypothetical protein [Halapricum desulfuricans]QSG15123.1 putative pilin/flagellin [Halapricum desulfuricans]
MADLGGDNRRPSGNNSRGQVMLIAAFVLAVSFLAVAVMLNAVIYSENLATRGEDARGSEAIAYRADIADGAGQLLEYANDNGTAFNDRTEAFNRTLRPMYNDTARVQAIDGIATDLSVRSISEGTLVAQRDPTRNFTNANGNEEWTLVENAAGTRAFRINVTNQGALASSTGDAFTVNVSDGTDEWSVSIYGNSTNTTVAVDGSSICTVGPTPSIDVTRGEINGKPCDPLVFASGVAGDYAIEFDDADAIVGTVSLVTNTTDYDTDNYDSDAPRVEAVIYSATLHLRHASADHVYATDVRVAPGETDA